MTENIVTGKKYRILTDAVNDVWDRISFWTKASDVYFSDNSTLEENKPVNALRRGSNYTVGMIAYERTAPSWVMLKCTQTGTTAATTPTTYSTITTLGTVITDGTAQFTVYDVRPSSTLSDSLYQIPTVNLINNINSELIVNGEKFYFDYQNDKYGFNTSPTRDASTFNPFSSGPVNSNYTRVGSGSSYTAIEKGMYFIYASYSWIDRINWSASVTIRVNGTSVSLLGTGGGSGSRDQGGVEQYYRCVVGMTFVELNVGDIVTAIGAGGWNGTYTISPIVWKYEA